MEELSVVIISFNEEKQIGRCLDSVRDIAGEIIVVDSFSTDRTREICLQHGVRFYEHTFEGYSEQKNFANSLARFDYILSLDADEALDAGLVQSIQNAAQAFDCDAYFMNRMVNYCGGWLLDGQKTWASRGAFAEWCFGLFRTDPSEQRHKGLTYFLIDMTSEGLTRRPIAQLDGSARLF